VPSRPLQSALLPSSPLPLLDVGGEGRHVRAWNLNPSGVKTLGAERGQPIPRHIPGRAEAIPLPDDSVRVVIVERTPLREAAIDELQRVVMPGGVLVLRHHVNAISDPHARVLQRRLGTAQSACIRRGNRCLQQTLVWLAKAQGG
jgi:hypothetical protein